VLGDDTLPGDQEEGEADQGEDNSTGEDEGFWFTFKI
jgi:hypothetical protein